MKRSKPSIKQWISGSAYKTTAHSGQWMDDDWMFMAEGYIRAAELAVEGCSRQDRNLILYPVFWLCRHSIELALKHSTNVGTHWQSKNTDHQPPHGHKILALWNRLRPIIDECFPSCESDRPEAVGRMIERFAELDPGGQVFRYPLGTKKERHFEDNLCVDLTDLTKSTREIFNFLKGCSYVFEDKLGHNQ